jgi:hypothetical protein
LTALLILIQIIQLPLFFKLGYTKAKFANILPFVVIMAGFATIMNVSRDTSGKLDWLWGALSAVTSGGVLVPLVVLALAIAICISYFLSIVFYQKREF